MNIVCAESVFKGEEIFDEFGDCTVISDKKIKNHDLKRTDALIIRSGTIVNQKLLDKTPVRFVGTATSGIDHIDLKWIKKNNVYFQDAKGSNAESVADYVITAILKIMSKDKVDFKGKKIAIVGYGAVGTILAKKAKSIGFKILLNDPPLLKNKRFNKINKSKSDNNREIRNKLKKLDEILPQADIVSIHTPLTTIGKWPTKNLVNKDFLDLIKKGAIFINTSRGGVCDESALLDAKKNGAIRHIVTDVWKDEPNYNVELCNQSIIATPHIAGHSYHAKFLGSYWIALSLSKLFKINFNQKSHYEKINLIKKTIHINIKTFVSEERAFLNIIDQAYGIIEDSNLMKETNKKTDIERLEAFKRMRLNYPMRREFRDIIIKSTFATKEFKKKLASLSFNVLD